ncbi:MAG TPA: hypothetical protein DD706_03245 [Nitrospiraceae bacterium]|nr:hypothetical protein [Nitrospiraceae bacterium]
MIRAGHLMSSIGRFCNFRGVRLLSWPIPFAAMCRKAAIIAMNGPLALPWNLSLINQISKARTEYAGGTI